VTQPLTHQSAETARMVGTDLPVMMSVRWVKPMRTTHSVCVIQRAGMALDVTLSAQDTASVTPPGSVIVTHKLADEVSTEVILVHSYSDLRQPC
jgi:hypothetical protein